MENGRTMCAPTEKRGATIVGATIGRPPARCVFYKIIAYEVAAEMLFSFPVDFAAKVWYSKTKTTQKGEQFHGSKQRDPVAGQEKSGYV